MKNTDNGEQAVVSVITITGEAATGKSTVAEALMEKLPGWRRANIGQKFREITAAQGNSIQAVSFLPASVHQEVDRWQRSIAESESELIIEGRLAGWLTRDLERVFRVYCYASLETRIERYARREKCSKEQAKQDIEFRDSRDVLKYRNTYGLEDYRDPSFYSLILDTSEAAPGELADAIIKQSGVIPNKIR